MRIRFAKMSAYLFPRPFPHSWPCYASPNASVLCRVAVLWHSTGREMGDLRCWGTAWTGGGVVSQGCCSVCRNPRPAVPLFVRCSIRDAASMQHCGLFAQWCWY
ncbi:hypothetical protein CGRA01v4_10378 [Colletotrichum graminicola]|nr:hypothetical protein CGRA01v4_10378 [Colletotrichum graminicola]